MKKGLLFLILNYLTISLIAQNDLPKQDDVRFHQKTVSVEENNIIEYENSSHLIEKRYEPNTKNWIDDTKFELTYDDEGYQSKAYLYAWNKNTDRWMPRIQYEPKYDNEAKLTQLTTYRYHTKYQQWIDEDVQVFSYDKNNFVSEILQYRYHNSQKKNASKKEFYYVGLVEEMIEYVWNIASNEWQTQSKTKKVFDKENKLKEIKLSSWDVRIGRWINFKKNVFTYTENGNLSSQEDFMWKMPNSNTIKGTWVASEKQQNSYELNRLSQTTYYNWNKNQQNWVERKKREYRQHDAKGRAIYQIIYTKNPVTQEWMAGFKNKYHFDKPVLDLVSNATDSGIANKTGSTQKIKQVQLFDVKHKHLYAQPISFDETLNYTPCY